MLLQEKPNGSSQSCPPWQNSPSKAAIHSRGEIQGFVALSETGNTQGWLYFYHCVGTDYHKLNQEEVPIALIWFTYCNRSAQTLVPQGQLLIGKMHVNLSQWIDWWQSSLLWPTRHNWLSTFTAASQSYVQCSSLPGLSTSETWPSHLTISRDLILVCHIDGMLDSLESRGIYTLMPW